MTTNDCYRDYRPAVHYSVPKGWMNDPNGLIFHNGYYHLYYQHYPDACKHGPMHWGHARSTNLVEWEDLPIALYPDELGTIFSGSMVYDIENTSGFGQDGTMPLVAVFTYHKDLGDGSYTQSQGVAYSLDGGMTFTKYRNNPVLTSGVSDFRDPKVVFHQETGRWIMVLAVQRSIQIYSSPNLKDWELTDTFTTSNPAPAGIWECPDLFRLPVEGTDLEKWVLLYSVNSPDAGYFGMQYFVGEFDGRTFAADTPDSTILLTDFGYDNYAAVTFGDTVDRKILLGWMNCWHYAPAIPCSTFRGSMTIPREIKLVSTPSGIVMVQAPVRELWDALDQKASYSMCSELALPAAPLAIQLEKPVGDLILTFSNPEHSLVITATDHHIAIDRRGCGCEDLGPVFFRAFGKACDATDRITILLDTTSAEVFTDGGKAVGTVQLFTGAPLTNFAASQSIPTLQIATQPRNDKLDLVTHRFLKTFIS